MANFQGHAGNADWEDAMSDPSTLGKLRESFLLF